ncbi:MAG: ParA family protein [Planctomycetota bacterium]|nr:MAG: ParA family protein [Planctomycetota bacterium]
MVIVRLVQIVAVINQKGGVGKTTACANLGAALALNGHDVLLIDLDPQAHLSISFDRMPPPGQPSLYSLLAGQHQLLDVLQETSIPNLYILPTNLDLTGAETEFASEIGRESLLRDALSVLHGLPEAPDVVMFDCPPSLGLMSLNALVAAQHVLIPVQAEFFALQGMAQLLEVVERVQRRLNPDLDLLGIVIGLFTKQRNLSREVLHELHTHFGDLLFPTLVRVNVRLAEAPSHGQTIFEYAPQSGAALDFRTVAAEIERRLGLLEPKPEPVESAAPELSSLPQPMVAETPATAPPESFPSRFQSREKPPAEDSQEEAELEQEASSSPSSSQPPAFRPSTSGNWPESSNL